MADDPDGTTSRRIGGLGVSRPTGLFSSGLGQRDPNRYPSPEGAEQSSSIPHVPLVIRNSVRDQQLLEFLLKAGHGAVDFLLRDVLHGFFHTRRAHRKRAVAALAMEPWLWQARSPILSRRRRERECEKLIRLPRQS